MGILYGFLIFVEIVVCALLIVIIFMQKTKGGMGGSAFGGGAGEAIFGSRMGNVLTKSTVVLGIIFLLNTLFLTALTTTRGAAGSLMEQAVQHAAPSPAQGVQGVDMGAADWTEVQPGAELPMGMDIPAGDDDVIQIAPTAVEADAVAMPVAHNDGMEPDSTEEDPSDPE